MLIFRREIEDKIREHLSGKGMVVILGPRQSGKTTLAKKLLEPFGAHGAYFNCEHAEVRRYFVLGEPDALLSLVGDKKVVVFDEAQTIPNIGKILKVFYDTYPHIKVIATGSSAFDLANKIREPLTGRAFEYMLYPLSLDEVRSVREVTPDALDELMIFGSYPAVVGALSPERKREEIKNIATNYLYKDVFTFEAIRNPKAFEDLLTHLAMRLGSTISTNDLSKELGITQVTVEKYIRLLEQSFVVKRVYSFARNYANELKKSYKVYFLDLGVRNALVGGLEGGYGDPDRGVLFESLFFAELLKRDMREPFPPKTYFWRTRDKREIDFIRVDGKVIRAYECKLTSNSTNNFNVFLKHYPDAKAFVVTPDNLLRGDSFE
jgi:predicted AAA+ superfamily ATPase